jgi:hypothetical protein
LALCAVPSFACAAQAAGTMTGDQVRKFISGKRVYLATPFGGEFPLSYHADGRLNGQVRGIAQLLRKSDSGNWWMSGDRMCQKWHNWYDGKTYCFQLEPAGVRAFMWHRDDRESGRGRVAN